MNITILCTDQNHPVVKNLIEWRNVMSAKSHIVSLVFDRADLIGGEILFLVSCSCIISESDRKKYKSVLVLHASNLPKRRGWSPHIWAILDGENNITVTLLEAAEPVDSGMIWLKKSFTLEGHELLDEINLKLFDAEISLMTEAVEQFNEINPIKQNGEIGEYMRRRKPQDSILDPEKSIIEQFNLLRVVDSVRYPAFFYYLGYKYKVKVEKVENE